MSRRLLFGALLIALAVVAAVLALLLTNGGGKPASQQTSTTSGVFTPDPNAASWDKPFKVGDPQATKYGEAFQVLDPAHPPAKAQDVYWLGLSYHGFYPYARAMLGGGAEVMLSTVVYADKQTVELSHLSITAYSTAPLKTIDPDTGSRQSEGGKLLHELEQAGAQPSGNGYQWAPVTTKALAPGTQAIVEISPQLVVQIVRLDGSVPPLKALVEALRPYPQ